MVMGQIRQEAEVVIVGGGPGGYVAALRAADLGKEVVLVDERRRLGGVCLHEGCIPSKALINAVETAAMAREARAFGLHIDGLRFDLLELRAFKDDVIDRLATGIDGLLARRGVEVIHGRAHFEGDRLLAIPGAPVSALEFKHCIIATGSRPNKLLLAGDLPVWSSREALELKEVPDRLLVVGGGYIGLELGLVYAGLGSKVTTVEFAPGLLMGADRDLVEVMTRATARRFAAVHTVSKVVAIREASCGFDVEIEGADGPLTLEADRVLVAIGRRPNTDDLGLESTSVKLSSAGRIQVDAQGRSSAPGIWAIGDVTPGPMLAHKASREAKVVAEVLADHPSAFDNRAIPSVVFTEPELAWTGLTQGEAEASGRSVRIGRFPLKALGRARTLGRTEGLVKILSDPESGLILGAGMVGHQASEHIAEMTLALEMGATLEDIIVTIHPHPTLSEAIVEAAEVAAGSAIHVSPAKKEKGK